MPSVNNAVAQGFVTSSSVTVSSYNVGAGTAGQRKLNVGIQLEDGTSPPTVSGITYGGTALTLYTGGTVTQGLNHGEAWFLDDTGIGSGSQTEDVVVTLTGSSDRGTVSVSWADDVEQGQRAQIATNSNSGATETAISASLTGVTADSLLLNYGGLGDAQTMTADGTQTTQTNAASGTMQGAFGSEVVGSGSHTQGWTFSSARRPNLILIELEETATGGAFTLVGDSGTYTYTGTAAAVEAQFLITGDSGSYAYTGTTLDLNQGFYLDASTGTYVYTGTANSVVSGRVVSADSGSYLYSGTAAVLTFAGAGAFTLEADSGAYTYAGTANALTVGRVLAADSGSYTYTGASVVLSYGRMLAADSGSYIYTGAAIAFSKASVLSADSGSYTYTGLAASLDYSGAGVWTKQTDSVTSWSDQADSTTTWTPQANNTTIWTEQ
jgi:hypothetical protein